MSQKINVTYPAQGYLVSAELIEIFVTGAIFVPIESDDRKFFICHDYSHGRLNRRDVIRFVEREESGWPTRSTYRRVTDVCELSPGRYVVSLTPIEAHILALERKRPNTFWSYDSRPTIDFRGLYKHALNTYSYARFVQERHCEAWHPAPSRRELVDVIDVDDCLVLTFAVQRVKPARLHQHCPNCWRTSDRQINIEGGSGRTRIKCACGHTVAAHSVDVAFEIWNSDALYVEASPNRIARALQVQIDEALEKQRREQQEHFESFVMSRIKYGFSVGYYP